MLDYFEQLYDFDDVLVRPIPSTVNSREDVDISIQLSEKLKLEFPVIASPMIEIIDAEFAIKLSELGGMAILPRFYDSDEQRLRDVRKLLNYHWGAAIEYNDKRWEDILDYEPNILCLDVANGYTDSIRRFCETLKNHILCNNLDTLLMAGNIATRGGFERLSDSGVDLVRCGIGSGALCSTRNVTAIGIPQITALMDCANANTTNASMLVADGGIRSSGDAIKAFIAGGEILMVGSLFAQTYESPNKGTIFGMASRRLQEMKFTQIKSVEGFEKAVEKKYSLKTFVDEFSWGIRSAGTYLNARNLQEMRQNGKFILAGKNSIKEL